MRVAGVAGSSHDGQVHAVFRWLAFLLATASVWVGASVFVRSAWAALRVSTGAVGSVPA
jgi:hypothetical protein